MTQDRPLQYINIVAKDKKSTPGIHTHDLVR
jgi:hypothetical protein